MPEMIADFFSCRAMRCALFYLIFSISYRWIAADIQTSLEIGDIMPEERKLYDKMRPPKKEGAPTIVYFHVTVMGLDSIDETSMVN